MNKRRPREEPWGCATENASRGKTAGGEIKETTIRLEGRKFEHEGARGGHGQRYHVLHRRYGQRKTRRFGNVEVTSDL